MNREILSRFLNKEVEVIYWDRDEREEVVVEGILIDIENEFVVVDYNDGVSRIFIGDLRNVELLE